MTDPYPYRIGVLSWYHDSKTGQRTHAWAEKPCPAPAILCESEEQADELLAARERCAELEQALRSALAVGGEMADLIGAACPDAGVWTDGLAGQWDEMEASAGRALAPRGDKATE